MMRNEIKFDGRIMAGPALSQERLEQLAHRQFNTVVDLSTDDELEEYVDDRPNTPQYREVGDRARVEGAGLEYVRIPVAPEQMKTRHFEAFRDEVDRHGYPLYISSKNGTRAAIFGLLIKAIEEQMDLDTALDRARDMGIRFRTPEEEDFFKAYIEECVPRLGG